MEEGGATWAGAAVYDSNDATAEKGCQPPRCTFQACTELNSHSLVTSKDKLITPVSIYFGTLSPSTCDDQ